MEQGALSGDMSSLVINSEGLGGGHVSVEKEAFSPSISKLHWGSPQPHNPCPPGSSKQIKLYLLGNMTIVKSPSLRKP